MMYEPSYELLGKVNYPNHQFIPIGISERKFDEQVEAFRADALNNEQRGIILSYAKFPLVILDYVIPGRVSSPVLFTAWLDFTNYDVCPISIRLKIPGAMHAMTKAEWVARFTGQIYPPGDAEKIPLRDKMFHLVQGYGGFPLFTCWVGVREYHNHPSHGGDSWFLTRGKPSGTLKKIANKLYTAGTAVLATSDYKIWNRDYRLIPPRGYWGLINSYCPSTV